MSLVSTKLPASGVTTFYDSVCGAPLFRAPVGRSLADFQAARHSASPASQSLAHS